MKRIFLSVVFLFIALCNGMQEPTACTDVVTQEGLVTNGFLIGLRHKLENFIGLACAQGVDFEADFTQKVIDKELEVFKTICSKPRQRWLNGVLSAFFRWQKTVKALLRAGIKLQAEYVVVPAFIWDECVFVPKQRLALVETVNQSKDYVTALKKEIALESYPIL